LEISGGFGLPESIILSFDRLVTKLTAGVFPGERTSSNR
jgi:hypothetical protein